MAENKLNNAETQSQSGNEDISSPANELTAKAKRGKRNLVAGVLGPALKLWLRSQVEAVEHLEVTIGSATGDGENLTSRQMLAGRIPSLQVEADGVIYQGLYLGQLQLAGQDIRMNLGQAVRGKPLKLMAPIAVEIALTLNEEQLNHSLASPLLAPQLGAWLNLLQGLLAAAPQADAGRLSQPGIALAGGTRDQNLAAERLGLQLCWQAHPPAAQAGEAPSTTEVSPTEIAIATGLTVHNGNLLQLHQPGWRKTPPPGFQDDLSPLAAMPLKLGNDVAIDRIAIASGQLHLTGQLTVQP